MAEPKALWGNGRVKSDLSRESGSERPGETGEPMAGDWAPALVGEGQWRTCKWVFFLSGQPRYMASALSWPMRSRAVSRAAPEWVQSSVLFLSCEGKRCEAMLSGIFHSVKCLSSYEKFPMPSSWLEVGERFLAMSSRM